MLSTTDISHKLKGLANFAGVFPVDSLPPASLARRFQKINFVVNTDSSNLPGTHWIAASYYGDYTPVEIFDSFALTPPAAVQLWCSRNASRHWISSKFCVQHPTATTCGLYCCQFLTRRPLFSSMDDCVNSLRVYK